MVTAVPLIVRVPRAPFSKPSPGLGIDWRHQFSKGLVHSFPFNEGRGEIIKNYAQPSGLYDLRFRVPGTADTPRWGTYDKVPGLQIDIDQGNPLEQKYGNTGSANANVTGGNLLPAIDFTKGFTVHLWMRPTESLVGVVVAYAMFAIGDINAATRSTMVIHLSRFAASGTDWWRRNIQVYSNGSASTNLTNSDEVWEAPFTGGRVKIDSLPYEHVISVTPGTTSGAIRWYSSDGYDFGFAAISTITPPDNNQYWPLVSPSGMSNFEGNIWGWNVWNYPMGREAAFALMRNPFQMYKARSTGGGYGANTVPGGVDPPDTDGNVTPGSSGPLLGPDPDRCTEATPQPYVDGSGNKNIFIYYGHQYEFLKDPLDVTRHDSYELDFGWTRWKFIRRLWFSGISNSTITLQIYVDEVLKHTTTFTMIPTSATGWAKTRLLLPPGLKGQLFRFVLTASSSFKVFLDQSDIEWHMLSGDRGYQRAQMMISHLHER